MKCPRPTAALTREECRDAVVRDLEAGEYLVKVEDYTFMPARSQRIGRPSRAPLAAPVVGGRQDPGQARHRSRRKWRHQDDPGDVGEDLL